MMLMYGSTVFIIAITSKRVKDGRLWYAPWLFPGQHASMAGLATSGTHPGFMRRWRELAPQKASPRSETSLPVKGPAMLPYFSGERTPTMIHGWYNLRLIYAHPWRSVSCSIWDHVGRHIFKPATMSAKPLNIFAVGGTRNGSGADTDIKSQTRSKSMGLIRRPSCGNRAGDANRRYQD
jgi:xylulokinase